MKKTKQKAKKAPKVLYIAGVLCALSLLALVLCLVLTAGRQGEFVPPAFDPSAQQGTPEVPEALGWAEIWQESMEFRAAVCGVFRAESGKADVYFTNLQEGAWLKLRVLDAQGSTLGETGLLRPGSYVRSVELTTLPENGDPVIMKLMAYEPETYHSLGAVSLQTVAVVGGE